MKYHNRFVGHLPRGDPRTTVEVAGGCPWPTIPPMRVAIGSDNATGLYTPLNDWNLILELHLTHASHEHGTWEPFSLPPTVYYCLLEKFFIKSKYPQYDWYLSIMMTLVGRTEIAFAPRTGKCNRDVTFGDQIGGILRGRVGSTFGFKQVEYDAMAPP